ncbi:MAG: hypothetical protein PHX15_02740 [Candidatus Nanoarchaeia archaeon]|jgi:hypothetical protein|nr:hypothetical protein [Candidatus Nanoarchaeia archaeon]MDD3994086.1 hypothetical protein [Candidatus Nanoarchaeia archaeon]MDD4563547.1 hypothetical protein [Candidatus Nanoarchaeia archaeon]
MKNKYFFGLLLLSVFLISSFVSSQEANATMKVRANILESNIGISVPNLIIMGDMSPGYLSERQDLNITNTGTVDLMITPELDENYEEDIFTHLSFKNILDDPLTKIGDYSLELLKPNTVGNTRSERVYMYLDLTDYSGELNQTLTDHEANVVFWATAL